MGRKKIEHELRGRRFKIETDHKALAEIRNKPDFNNARVNRWAEKIQEFGFEIGYMRPEELIVADCLSRIYTTEAAEKKKKMINAKKEIQIGGKRNKHVKEVNGKKDLVI